ncbi:hypothetical protein FC72_GL002037 [Companilactobacillus tucceti DSM 20183]|uniref:Uncharacterized protein n=1 Tax=Companilactobacillus tucceti DSM 20183 TaxID=1423811 RepID=A0A0R1IZL0_9LACO|nr:hypothetical protein [Companilactobacillus tucceti]KRK64629.1 hypothetical protein FC72_GL002037 [Companilactobacillus tucceti DSM 20183]
MSFFDRKKKDSPDTGNNYEQNNMEPYQGSQFQPEFNNDPQQFQQVQPQEQPQQGPTQPYSQGPEMPGYYYEEQPVPEAENADDWQYTEQDLENVLEQTDSLKSKLRHELLAERSYSNHILRSAGVDENDLRENAAAKIKTINDSLRKWFDTDEMANEIFLDPNRNYFIFTDHLSADPDHHESQMWKQINQTLLEKNLIANAISVSYDDHANETWMDYQNNDMASNNAYLLNMYNDLQDRNNNIPITPAEVPFEEDYHVEHLDDNKDKIINSNNELIMEVSRDNDQNLQVIRHYKKGKLLSRDIFDVNGVISATQFYDHHDPNKVVRENFYRQDGTLVMIKSYTDDEPLIQLFTPGNVLINTFESDDELIVWWLKHQALRQVSATIFVSIDSKYYKELLDLRKAGFEIIPVVMTQDQNAKSISELLNGTDKITAVFAGSDKVNGYLNKNAKIKMDISTLADVETPVYKQ